VKKGDRVSFYLNPFLLNRGKVEVLYDKGGVVVLNKPPFINSNEDKPNLEEELRKEGLKVKVVHRLDKQTSGLIIGVREPQLFEAFKEAFKKKRVRKVYRALLLGRLKGEKRVKLPLDGKEAVSVFRPIELFKECTLAEVEIETGRKHQIRRHGAKIGHPVLGDFLYWKRGWPYGLVPTPRIALHSYRLEFEHPKTKERVKVKVQEPEDLLAYLKELRER